MDEVTFTHDQLRLFLAPMSADVLMDIRDMVRRGSPAEGSAVFDQLIQDVLQHRGDSNIEL